MISSKILTYVYAQCRASSRRLAIILLADDGRIKPLSERDRRLTASEVTAEMNANRERHISVSIVKSVKSLLKNIATGQWIFSKSTVDELI